MTPTLAQAITETISDLCKPEPSQFGLVIRYAKILDPEATIWQFRLDGEPKLLIVLKDGSELRY